MFKKIANLSIWNLLYSLINFLSNFIIVKFYGVAVFGEFSSYSAYIAVGALLFVVLPPSYSIFKCQDDEKYRFIFANFFLGATLFYIFFLFLLNWSNFTNVSIGISVVYSISLVWQNYFDVIFQSKNKLKQYFIMLTVVSVVKVLALWFATFINIRCTFGNLLLIIGVCQSLVLVPYLYFERNLLVKSISYTIITHNFIKNNFHEFKGYYLNIGLKRIQEYSSILLFTPLLSKENLGVYSLFIKVISFVLGFSRIFEMFFNIRENLDNHFKNINSKSTKIGIILQLVFVFTGIIYLYILLQKFYLIQLILLSFLFPLFTKVVFARAHFLSQYQNLYLNYSSLIFIAVNLIGFLYCWSFNASSLNSIIGIYFLSNFLSNFYLIRKFNSLYL